MDITGIKVIRNNSGVAIDVLPGERIELTYGDTLKVNISFDYRGLAVPATLYGAIGNRGWISFDEIFNGEQTFELPESRTDFTPVVASVEIPITFDIDPGTDYDLYVKIKEYSEAGYPEVDDIIDIVGIPPTFELIEETIYPYAYIYDGPSEVGTFTFTTIPFTSASWIAGRMASLVEDEVRKSGGRIMEMRVYVDESQWRPWTDWRIDVITKPPGTTAGTAMPVGIAWWAVAILAVLAIILIIVITYSVKQLAGIFDRYPDLEDVKPGWGKETLMLAIHDSEEYWERTLTPTETLDGMSEDELRELLDQIAEEEVKPALPDWLPWAIIGGVVVVGGGVAAIALTTRGK